MKSKDKMRLKIFRRNSPRPALDRSREYSERDCGKFAASMSWVKLLPQMLQLAILVLQTWRR
jgi:hypothetical protein